MKERKSYKAINFDLDTKKLSCYFAQPLKAYAKLKKDFKQLGFKHRQWSGYISKNKITDLEVITAVKILSKQNPWLAHTVNKFDVSNISKTFDLTGAIKESSQSTKSNISPFISITKNTATSINNNPVEEKVQEPTQASIKDIIQEKKDRLFKNTGRTFEEIQQSIANKNQNNKKGDTDINIHEHER